MDAETVKRMKVTELREHLQSLGLPTTGRKEELVSRLLSAAPTNTTTTAKSPSPLPAPKPAPHAPTADLLDLDPMSVERLRARRERFGCDASALLRSKEEEEARLRRAARFGQ
jgi:hypothetical protein